MRYIIDIECTRQKNPLTGKDDPSPYNEKNKLVTVQFKNIDTGIKYCVPFFHKKWENTEAIGISHRLIKKVLSTATLVIGHNIKFDIQWLLHCGFEYIGPLYDTMIFEYITAKGMKKPMGLKDLALKYKLPLKLDILQDYWDKGVNTDEVPYGELKEYALQDLETTHALYKLHEKLLAEDIDVNFMKPSIQLTHEALWGVIEMEKNGCCIDLPVLESVEKEYVQELEQLERGIRLMIGEKMGDTPINLSSPDDMSKLLYGIEFKDKEAKKRWTIGLDIGTDERNAVKKKKYPKRLNKTEFRKLKSDVFKTVFKTRAYQCPTCYGSGKIRKIKKDGEPFKKENICTECLGQKFKYEQLGKRYAGLRLRADDTFYATAAGFAADKKVIEKYLNDPSVDDEEKLFLKALQRHSSITSYLATFVEGIRNNVREDLLLHTSLNQCITATGRLSSSGPNFQNLPRGNTFPVRKAIKSRFKSGYILEVDFTGIEYRTAVMLANCQIGLESIVSGKDRHQITAEIIFGKPKSEYTTDIWKTVRHNAKSHTFKPLYGGVSGTEAEQRYYKAFLAEHKGIAKWHEELCNEALKYKQIKTFTGRIFAFPKVSRMQGGRVRGKTQIVNYPVQSVATADIIWVVVVDILKEMLSNKVKSKLILQVHDSVILDVHPEEKELMIKLVKNSFDRVHELLYTRYKFETPVPIDNEMSIGENWNDKIAI